MENGFRYLLSSESGKFKFAKGSPTYEGREFHCYDEILYFIDGETQFISKNIQVDLKKGSMVIIPKEHFHQFIVSNQITYTRCVLEFFESEKIGSILGEVFSDVTLITEPDEELKELFEELIRISKSNLPTPEKSKLLDSVAYQMLVKLKYSDFFGVQENVTVSKLTEDTLFYIDKNYCNEISVPEIAKTLNISESTLAHKFREELNISVYRYILKKRLSEARQLISKGESFSVASSKSGFNDYSNFFRLYKREYGEPPSVVTQK